MLHPPQDVMLARAVTRLPAAGSLSGGCLYEPKWDGYRALLFCADTGTVVQSRRGSDITAAFPDIAGAAGAQLTPGTVLDGELVIWGECGLDFPALQRRAAAPARAATAAARRPANFVVFDLLAADGNDVRRRPLRQRRHRLEHLANGFAPPIQLSPSTTDEDEARAMLDDYAEARTGVEGLVIKGLADPYQPGGRGWLKFKIRATADAVVGAVTGPLEAPEQLVLGLYDERGQLTVAGRTGRLRKHQREAVAPFLREPTSPHPWPTELPAGRFGRWSRDKVAVTLVEPSLVVEISADTAFENGKWRHLTSLVRPRADRAPKKVTAPGW